jgi:uncharacterized protein
MPKFEVYKDLAGKTRFRLKADDNQIVAVGEACEKHASCLKGIHSVQRNYNSPIEDLTVTGSPPVPNPKFVVYRDSSDMFRFRLEAANGELIAQGEGYESKEGCLKGIEVVRDSPWAQIDDPYAKESETESQEASIETGFFHLQTQNFVPVAGQTEMLEPLILLRIPLFGVELAANLAFGATSFVLDFERTMRQAPTKAKPKPTS